VLGRSHSTDSFDLKEVDWHSDKGIEHDASLFRMYSLLSLLSFVLIESTPIGRDVHFEPDQSVIHLPYIRELLDSTTGKDEDGNPLLTPADLSRMSSKRRAEARAENPEFTPLSKTHKIFGSAKYVSKDSVSLYPSAYFVISAVLRYLPSSAVA